MTGELHATRLLACGVELLSSLYKCCRVCTYCLPNPRHICWQVFFFFTLVTGPRRSLILKLGDTRDYEPQVRAFLGTTGGSHDRRATRLLASASSCSLHTPTLSHAHTLTRSHSHTVTCESVRV